MWLRVTFRVRTTCVRHAQPTRPRPTPQGVGCVAVGLFSNMLIMTVLCCCMAWWLNDNVIPFKAAAHAVLPAAVTVSNGEQGAVHVLCLCDGRRLRDQLRVRGGDVVLHTQHTAMTPP